VSAVSSPPSSVSGPGPAPMRCPVCRAELAPEQNWCLTCGAPARTRIARAPNWRVPVIAVLLAIALSIAGLAYAFVKLSDSSGPVTATTPTTTVSPAPPAAGAPAAPAPSAPAAPAPSAPAAPAPSAPAAPSTVPPRR